MLTSSRVGQDGLVTMDLGLEGNDEWWFNLRTQEVEQGPGSPNAERMGPYASRSEAEHALQHAREVSDAYDGDDD